MELYPVHEKNYNHKTNLKKSTRPYILKRPCFLLNIFFLKFAQIFETTCIIYIRLIKKTFYTRVNRRGFMSLKIFIVLSTFFYVLQSYGAEKPTKRCDIKPLMKRAVKYMGVNFPNKIPRKLWVCRSDRKTIGPNSDGPCPKNPSKILKCYSNARKGFYPFVCFDELEFQTLTVIENNNKPKKLKKVKFKEMYIVTKNRFGDIEEKEWLLWYNKCNLKWAGTLTTKKDGTIKEEDDMYGIECAELLNRIATGGEMYNPSFNDNPPTKEGKNHSFCTSTKNTLKKNYLKSLKDRIKRAAKCIDLFPSLEHDYKREFEPSSPTEARGSNEGKSFNR